METNVEPHIYMEPPSISTGPPCDPEVAISFRTAVQCWQLLHSIEILQLDFKQLLLSLPCSTYVNQFLVDLAFYVGQPEEAQTILNDSTLCNNPFEKNLRNLSLSLHQPTTQIQTIEFLIKIVSDLPTTDGNWIDNFTGTTKGRHVIFLPLTKRAVLQYCVKILINALKVGSIVNFILFGFYYSPFFYCSPKFSLSRQNAMTRFWEIFSRYFN